MKTDMKLEEAIMSFKNLQATAIFRNLAGL